MARSARLQLPVAATLPSGHGAAGESSTGSMGEAGRMLTGMLLAAVMAAFLLLADGLIDWCVHDHNLVAWVALWALAFAALAVLATPLRRLCASAALVLVRNSVRARGQLAETRVWEQVRRDPRLQAEILAAVRRG